MWKPRSKRSFEDIRYKQRLRAIPSPLVERENGQVIVEYLLIVAVVLGAGMVLAKPLMAKLGDKFQKEFKGGMFKDDPTGSGFYYYPVKADKKKASSKPATATKP